MNEKCDACGKRLILGLTAYKYILTISDENGQRKYTLCKRCAKTGREPKDAKMR